VVKAEKVTELRAFTVHPQRFLYLPRYPEAEEKTAICTLVFVLCCSRLVLFLTGFWLATEPEANLQDIVYSVSNLKRLFMDPDQSQRKFFFEIMWKFLSMGLQYCLCHFQNIWIFSDWQISYFQLELTLVLSKIFIPDPFWIRIRNLTCGSRSGSCNNSRSDWIEIWIRIQLDPDPNLDLTGSVSQSGSETLIVYICRMSFILSWK